MDSDRRERALPPAEKHVDVVVPHKVLLVVALAALALLPFERQARLLVLLALLGDELVKLLRGDGKEGKSIPSRRVEAGTSTFRATACSLQALASLDPGRR